MILLALVFAMQRCFDLGKVASGGRHTGDLGFVGEVVVSDSSRSVHSQRLGSKRWGDHQRPREVPAPANEGYNGLDRFQRSE